MNSNTKNIDVKPYRQDVHIGSIASDGVHMKMKMELKIDEKFFKNVQHVQQIQLIDVQSVSASKQLYEKIMTSNTKLGDICCVCKRGKSKKWF